MKTSTLIIAISALTLGSGLSALAGPGVDYWNRSAARRSEKSEAAASVQNTAGCKITEVTRLVRGYRGTVKTEVISSKMDCSACKDPAMACCAAKSGS